MESTETAEFKWAEKARSKTADARVEDSVGPNKYRPITITEEGIASQDMASPTASAFTTSGLSMPLESDDRHEKS